MTPTLADQKRFWAKVEIDWKSGCMLWCGATDGRGGYGKFKIGGRAVRAIRWVYALYSPGRLRKHHKVMHACDNPRCVRPDHLTIGTHRQNMRDMAKKGRVGGRGGRFITADDVDLIRFCALEGARPKAIAGALGFNYSTVRGIVEGKRHRPRAPKAQLALPGLAC